MRTFIGCLSDPCIHLLVLGVILIRLALGIAPVEDEGNVAVSSCQVKRCPVCQILRDPDDEYPSVLSPGIAVAVSSR